jgi:hypothetical protein
LGESADGKGGIGIERTDLVRLQAATASCPALAGSPLPGYSHRALLWRSLKSTLLQESGSKSKYLAGNGEGL